MADGRKNNGGAREGAGRPPKTEEQALIEKLSPLEDEAHAKLKEAIQAGEQWAVKMFFEYMYGKPKQGIDLTSKGNQILAAPIVFSDKTED